MGQAYAADPVSQSGSHTESGHSPEQLSCSDALVQAAPPRRAAISTHAFQCGAGVGGGWVGGGGEVRVPDRVGGEQDASVISTHSPLA